MATAPRFSPRSHIANSARRRNRQTRQVVVESLEQRLVLATHTWTGTVSNLWSVAGNWTGGSPLGDASADLIFPASGASNLANNNNLAAGTTINSIAIQGSGYNITGNAILLNTGITGTFAT